MIWCNPKDSGGQGSKDSSDMLKNYTNLKVWQKSYGLFIEEKPPRIIFGLSILAMDPIVSWRPKPCFQRA